MIRSVPLLPTASHIANRAWLGRTPTERVRIYTLSALYGVLIALVVLGFIAALSGPREAWYAVCVLAVMSSLATGGYLILRDVTRPGEPDPPRILGIGLLLGAAIAGLGMSLMVPPDEVKGWSIFMIFALAWGLGGLADRRVWWALITGCLVMVWVMSGGDLGRTAYAGGVAVFLVFTMQSSLWLLRVVEELETGRQQGAELAVAQERLRFSRDVHDVMGRRLSEIAVQAELAGAYSARSDPRLAGTLIDVRQTAHTALREARELARGYRPVDLDRELEGARALLMSAGIDSHTDVVGLPETWVEPVARVVREAITNVLRHSRATTVAISFRDGVVAIRNDGVTSVAATPGQGLTGLAEIVAGIHARIETAQEDGHFELRVVPKG